MTLKKPKGLGRGLEALLGPRLDDSIDGHDASAERTSQLPWGDLVPGAYQPRTRMDEGALYELAESIKAQGIMQPILVRALAPELGAQRLAQWQAQQGLSTEPHGGARPVYEIIAGERRFRAARLAGLDSVPVLVREVSDQAAAAMALIENMQREDLNALEQAQGLQRLVQEFGLTHEQAAQAVGRSRSAASNLLRLLQLAEPVQALLMAGDLDMGHARALLALERASQISAAHQISAQGLSVREAERLAKKLTQSAAPGTAAPAKRAARAPSPDLLQLERELSDHLGAAVQVRVKKRVQRGAHLDEQGELAIAFGSLDALDGLLERLRAA